ncbi:hypothetical protein NM63023_2243 [Neisseria meningitidis 63023]|nr:hypothetical protein NM63023_2243 [Neisseria meningitidis 63023]
MIFHIIIFLCSSLSSFAVKHSFGYLLCIKKCRLKAEYCFRRHFDCLKRRQFYKWKEMLKLLINFRIFL